jgi:hypothetical protein
MPTPRYFNVLTGFLAYLAGGLRYSGALLASFFNPKRFAS